MSGLDGCCQRILRHRGTNLGKAKRDAEEAVLAYLCGVLEGDSGGNPQMQMRESTNVKRTSPKLVGFTTTPFSVNAVMINLSVHKHMRYRPLPGILYGTALNPSQVVACAAASGDHGQSEDAATLTRGCRHG